jgi:rubrerythrin
LQNLGKNEGVDYYVCPFCGNTVEKAPPEKCPICGAPGKKFMKIA